MSDNNSTETQQSIQPITHNFDVPVDPMDLLQCESCQ